MPDSATLDAVLEEVRRLRASIDAQAIPTSRKYPISECETPSGTLYSPVGVRLASGKDPMDLTPEQIDRLDAPSKATVYRLISRGVIRKIKVGGASYVTEAEIQQYERLLEDGHIDGYDVPKHLQK